MTRFNYFIGVLFLIFCSSNVSGQTYKFLATGFSVMEKDQKGDWGKWSNLQEAAITITLDTNKNRIVVYSQEIQLYKIAEYKEKEENDNDLIYPFICANEEGELFTITIITRKNQNNRKQMYISYKDFILVYNIINYPEKTD